MSLRRRFGHAMSPTEIAAKLEGMGASKHAMMPDAVAHTRGASMAQVWFFAMTSRRDDARVFDAAIAKDPIARLARQIGGVTKMGYVVDGTAYILPKS